MVTAVFLKMRQIMPQSLHRLCYIEQEDVHGPRLGHQYLLTRQIDGKQAEDYLDWRCLPSPSSCGLASTF